MRRLLDALLLAWLGCLILAGFGSHAEASSSWQASPAFRLDPEPFPGPLEGAVKARYRLLDSQGRLLQFPPEKPVTELIQVAEVPPVPGIYTLEAWLEDAAGDELRRGVATLRFDNAMPPPPITEAPDRWLLGTEPATLKILQPAGPAPLSGIDGFAISTDRGDGGSPCAGPVCAAHEIDLAATDAGPISLGILPEGTTFARVATVSGSGVPSEVETLALKVDATFPSLSISGIPSGWSREPVVVTARATDHLSGMAAAGPLGPFTAISVDGRPPAIAAGGTVSTWVGGSGVHAIELYARDAAGNIADGGAGSPPPKRELIRIDEEAPRVFFAAAQDPAEPERIEATVLDSLSGPAPSRGSISVRLTGTRSSFQELPTRIAGDKLVARWDSDSFPPGKYEFRATGFDRAGNAATGMSRLRGGRMVLVNPLKLPVVLEAGFRGKRGSWRLQRATSRAGRVDFGGRLRTATGAPAAGLEVEVTETFAEGANPAQRVTYARTRADGSFSVRLKRGPSREVTASFAGNSVLTKASGRPVRLDVRTSLRLRASARVARIGGGPVVFSGKVGRAGAKRVAGLPVELQFRYPGAKWSEFRTVETDARGRFRYAYRFSDDDSRGVRFQFRAYATGREGWPYEPNASRPISVIGR